jgi:hypothetical protein
VVASGVWLGLTLTPPSSDGASAVGLDVRVSF